MNKKKEMRVWAFVVYGFLILNCVLYWLASNNVTTYSKQTLGLIVLLSIITAAVAVAAIVRTRGWIIFIPALILAIITTLLNYFSYWFSGYIF